LQDNNDDTFGDNSSRNREAALEWEMGAVTAEYDVSEAPTSCFVTIAVALLVTWL
jgi:hypothetical protein